jgi:hypothetical protein
MAGDVSACALARRDPPEMTAKTRKAQTTKLNARMTSSCSKMFF